MYLEPLGLPAPTMEPFIITTCHQQPIVLAAGAIGETRGYRSTDQSNGSDKSSILKIKKKPGNSVELQLR